MINAKVIAFYLIFILTLSNVSAACDLLSIEIGSDKSELELYFETITEDDDDVTIVVDQVDAFCGKDEVDLGEVLIRGYVFNGKTAGFQIEVQNDLEGSESKKKLLYNYVASRFGSIEDTSSEWPGYQQWDIGNKLIFYYKMNDNKKAIQEGVYITSEKYFQTLNGNE